MTPAERLVSLRLPRSGPLIPHLTSADTHGRDTPIPAVWRIWPFAAVLATILGSLSALVLYWGLQVAARPISVPQALVGVADWYLWAALAPLAAWFGFRFPTGPDQRYFGVLPHLVTGTLLALVELAAFTLYNGWYNRVVLGFGTPPFSMNYPTIVAQWFPVALLVYWLIVTAVSVYDHQRRYRAKELSAARLETELTQAQLEVLRGQLHPHFLFNALNTVTVLMREGRNEQAADTLASLGGLLRRSLDSSSDTLVPIRDEVAFVKEYLAIERQRYGDRIEVAYAIDQAALDVRVPALMLQPIVENAVRHGVAKVTHGGRIDIEIDVQDGQLQVTVRDSGPGFAASAATGESRGVGLANTAQRLARLYGDAHEFTTRNVPTGAEVTIRLPARLE